MSLLDRCMIHGWPMRRAEKGGSTLLKTETAAFLLMAIAVSWCILMAGDGAAAFIYFQF